MKLLALLLCVILTVSSGVFAQTEQPAEEVFTKFETLRGEVVDSHGNKIEKCSVGVALYYNNGIGKLRDKEENLRLGEANDAEGEFSFDVEKPIALNSNPRLVCRVTADGYLQGGKSVFKRSELAKFDGNFGQIVLKRAVKVTGRLTMPASAGDESLLEPTVRFTTTKKSVTRRLHPPLEISEDGSFEVTLPEDCQVKMAAYSNNAAAISKTVTIEKIDPAKDGQDLGEIRLLEGVAVSGVVLTRDGRPVENQAVYLSQVLDGQYIHASAITDALGEFELAPRLGNVVVKLNERVDEDGKVPNSTGRKLTAKAVTLKLRQGEAVKPIEFREAEAFLVTGSVALEDGRVPSNVYVAISNSEDHRHEQINVGDEGVFKFAVPRGVKISLIIAYYGDDEETYFVSSLTSDSLNKHRSALEKYEDEAQIFNLKPIEKHIGPLDFVLQEHIPEHSTATEEVFNWILGE